MPKLMIAYGSNLNKRAMKVRCPTAKPIGKFMLTGAKLVFRGVADVECSPDGKVPCGLWLINRADEAALDRYEGAPHMYYKEEGIVLKYAGRPQNALIYLMRSDCVYPPSQHYVDTIRKGYKDFGLDESYLDEAIKASFEKSPDEQTTSRRERQKADKRQRRLVEVPEAVVRRRLAMRGADLVTGGLTETGS